MTATERVVFPSGYDVPNGATAIELEPIGSDLSLRDRRAESQRRIHEHRAVRGLTQPTAGGACLHERLDEHRHRCVRRIQVVGGHVAERAR